MKPIKKILIANRGEIATRVIQSAKEMGIETVAIYAQDDKNSQFVQNADQAHLLSGKTLHETYLNQEAIIGIAKKLSCDAIHPGYGFLAENHSFAKNVNENGIIFIGPNAKTISLMGNKRQAKSIAEKAGLPLLPGFHKNKQLSNDNLRLEAKKIGFPVLIKASAGGGGKGMQIAENEKDFIDKLESVKRVALSAFGSDEIILEKFLMSPRHVEVQILADKHKNCWVLGIRDCSLQRRYQKIIEETPAPYLAQKTIQKIEKSVKHLISEISYVGAGTVEFLYENNQFYFMEMNTRLQVEHRVTEKTYNIDLVQWQIRIAQDEKLLQSPPSSHGHSIECRLYAENPYNNFLPSTGTLHFVSFPETVNILIDSSIKTGHIVSPHYDPMLAKVISWGKTRQEATLKIKHALLQTRICGIHTNRKLLIDILSSEEFIQNSFSTKTVESELTQLYQNIDTVNQESYHMIAIRSFQQHLQQKANTWKTKGWRINTPPCYHFTYILENETHHLKVTFHEKTQEFHVQQNEDRFIYPVDTLPTIDLYRHGHQLYAYFSSGIELTLTLPNRDFYNCLSQETESSLKAPMPGKIVKLLVNEGNNVTTGSAIIILEAMKMEHKITAPYNGIIKKLFCRLHENVEEGKQLVDITKKESNATQ